MVLLRRQEGQYLLLDGRLGFRRKDVSINHFRFEREVKKRKKKKKKKGGGRPIGAGTISLIDKSTGREVWLH